MAPVLSVRGLSLKAVPSNVFVDSLYLLREDIPRRLPLRPGTAGQLSGRQFSSSYLSLTPNRSHFPHSKCRVGLKTIHQHCSWESLFSAGEDFPFKHWGRNFVEKTERWRQKNGRCFFRWFSREADGGYCLLTSSDSHCLRLFLHSLYISIWKYSCV
jgi:hypothetical protein